MMWKFKTDIAFITIQDTSTDEKIEDKCPTIKITYRIEDFSGCLYHRELNMDSLEALHPMFRVDPSIFRVIIKAKPTTTLVKDSIICHYKFDILGRPQFLDVSIPPKTYPPDSNLETLELQKNIQAMKIEIRTLKTVIDLIMRRQYGSHDHNVFTETLLDSLEFNGLLLSQKTGQGYTFLHQAMCSNWKVDVVRKDLFDIDAIDNDGNTALHHVSPDNIDLAIKIIEAGADVNIRKKNGDTVLKLLLCIENFNNAARPPEEKFMRILTMLLEKGVDVNIRYNHTNFHILQTAGQIIQVKELLIKYGARV